MRICCRHRHDRASAHQPSSITSGSSATRRKMECTRLEGSDRRLTKESIAGGPVTCVSFLSETFSWVARGGAFLELAPLVVQVGSRRRTHLVFPEGGTIHGCQHGKSISVVFGGRQLAILHGGRSSDDPIVSAAIEPTSSRDGHRPSTSLIVSDWIWNLKLIVRESTDDLRAGKSYSRLGVGEQCM